MHRRHFRIAAIVFAYLASAVSFPSLQSALAGSPDAWGGPLVLAFLLPTAATATCLLLRQLAARDPLRRNYERFRDTYELVLDAAVAFVVGLHSILLATLLGGLPWIARAPSLLVGVLLILVGNVLPRVRPNLLVGIRTPWTLDHERAWARTHRVSGYALVAFGAIVLAFAAFAPQRLGRVVSLGAFGLALALVAASFWIRRTLRPRGPSTDASPEPEPHRQSGFGSLPGTKTGEPRE